MYSGTLAAKVKWLFRVVCEKYFIIHPFRQHRIGGRTFKTQSSNHPMCQTPAFLDLDNLCRMYINLYLRKIIKLYLYLVKRRRHLVFVLSLKIRDAMLVHD